MGRKSAKKTRKPITKKVTIWLGDLLICLQHEKIEQMSIDDLARLAGKSKSTLYEYFESKEEVILAACTNKIKGIENNLIQKQSSKNPIKLYQQLVEVFAEGTSEISLAFLQGIKLHYPTSWLTIETFTNKFIDLLKEQYTKGINEGLYTQINVELLGQIDKLFISQVVTNPAIFTDTKYKLSELIRDYLNLRLHGLIKK